MENQRNDEKIFKIILQEDEKVDDKINNDKKEDDESVGRYELVESWSQTLDFSKKKKGTQCDAIEVEAADTQVIIHCSYSTHQIL